MPDDKSKPTIEDFMDNLKDFGKEPLETPLTEQERRLATVAMAYNAAIIQLSNEGIIPPGQEIHFQMHAMDFINRLWNGEAINFPNTPQTLKVDSQTGKLYADASEQYLTRGTEFYKNIRNILQEVVEARNEAVPGEDNANEQTNKDENDRPKYLN